MNIYKAKLHRFEKPKTLPKKIASNFITGRNDIFKYMKEGVAHYESDEYKAMGISFGKLLDRATK